MAYSSITFNGNQIGTDVSEGRYTERVQHGKMPRRDLNVVDLSGDDGSVITDAKFREKEIEFRTVIVKSTETELKAALDDFKEKLSGEEKYLVITDKNESIERRYIATLKNMDVIVKGTLAEIEYSFIVPKGVGEEIGVTSPVDNANLTLSYVPGYYGYYGGPNFVIQGSYPAKPTITLTLNSDFDTIQGLSITNVETGEEMIIQGNGNPYTWLQGDEIVIDFRTGVIMYNNKEIGFNGVFPSFKTGTNYFFIKAGDIVAESFAIEDFTDSRIQNLAINSSVVKYAQSFVLKETIDTFSGIMLPIRKVGSPGPMKVWIYSGDAYPTDEEVIIYHKTLGPDDDWDTLGANDVYTFYTWLQRKTAGVYTLYSNRKYWIVMQATGVNGSNYYEVAYFIDKDATYDKGYLAVTNGADTWYNYFLYDLLFKILCGGSPENGKSIIVDIDYHKTYL